MDGYRLVFWMNVLSPHQMPYIRRLKSDNRVGQVIVNVAESMSAFRASMGWEGQDQQQDDRLQINIAPDIKEIEKILSEKPSDSIHFFSGINAFKFVFTCFKASLKYNMRRGIITEGPFTYFLGMPQGKPLWLHKLRFFLTNSKYIADINYIFAIGEMAQIFYKNISDKWEVVPFIYCTNTLEELSFCRQKENLTKFLFVGSMISRKNPGLIIEASTKLTDVNYELNFIGDGDRLATCQHLASKMTNVTFLGKKKINEIPAHLFKNDVLILPSKYDGWGAVVNEALLTGMFVVCSDNCGSKDLIKPGTNGIIFKSGSAQSLSEAMKWCLEHIDLIRSNRKNRLELAKTKITANVISRYFVDYLDKPALPPWK
jgi:glycosyltransferase involved in cell wall biosynthesis